MADVRTRLARRVGWALCALAVLGVAPRLGRAEPPGGMSVMVAGGERYVNLKDVASFYGFSFRVPPGKKIYLQTKWNSLVFEIESRQVFFNKMAVWMHAPVLKLRGKWVITEADMRKVIDPLLRPAIYLASRNYSVVVLDPGHGGPDRGARGRRGTEEKKAVLEIAKRVRAHLVNAGYKVYITRETDRFIELEDRTWKASKWNANIFVSIHLNSSVSSAPRGLETYVLAAAGYSPTAASPGTRVDRVAYLGNRYDGANALLGYYLQKSMLAKVKGEDRGLRRARFVVLKNAPCPAALVECGFLSNSGEESRLATSSHQETVALAITQGILDYSAAIKKARPAPPPKKKAP